MNRLKSVLLVSGLVYLTSPTIALAQSKPVAKPSKPAAHLSSSDLEHIKRCRQIEHMDDISALQESDIHDVDYCAEFLDQYFSRHSLQPLYMRRTDLTTVWYHTANAENERLVRKYNSLVQDYNTLIDKHKKLRDEYVKTLDEFEQTLKIDQELTAFMDAHLRQDREIAAMEARNDANEAESQRRFNNAMSESNARIAYWRDLIEKRKAYDREDELRRAKDEAFQEGVAAGSLRH